MSSIKQAAAELAQIAGLEDEEQTQGQKFEWRNNLSKWSECKKEMQSQVSGKLKFISHYNHKISGKAQLINQNMQQLTFITRVKIKEEGKESLSIKVFGDSIDKRKEEIDTMLSEYCWIYKVVSNKKDYIVISFKELGNVVYTLRGMNIRLSMPTEVSKQLSLKGFANVFLCYDAEPAIKTLSKEQLIELTKKTKFTVQDFLLYNFKHPNGEIYEQPEEYMALRAAQLLSGKYEGYPLHSLTIGIAGTGKSMEAESLDNKMKEEQGILEAANSRPKSLVPSFKGNPATPGYILSCIRLAIIDELMKMIEAAAVGTRQQESVQNLLSQLNMLLEHKLRTIGSGNENFMKCQATAKCFFVTNPFSFKRTLAEHASIVDITVLSRLIPYCQDSNHLEFLRAQKSGNTLKYNKEYCGNTYTIYTNNTNTNTFTNPSYTTFPLCVTTTLIDDNDYLSILDSSNSFIVESENEKLNNLYSAVLNLLENPTLKEIFAPRGKHHLRLLFDGLVKLRCLFRDYDSTFTPIEEDYDELEKLIYFIVSTWNTDFSKLGDSL